MLKLSQRLDPKTFVFSIERFPNEPRTQIMLTSIIVLGVIPCNHSYFYCVFKYVSFFV